MIRETLAKLPETVLRNVETLRKEYTGGVVNKDVARAQSYWYGVGLRDAGLITERERQIIFVYTTV